MAKEYFSLEGQVLRLSEPQFHRAVTTKAVTGLMTKIENSATIVAKRCQVTMMVSIGNAMIRMVKNLEKLHSKLKAHEATQDDEHLQGIHVDILLFQAPLERLGTTLAPDLVILKAWV